MRRVKDDWVNATQILKCCNIQKARRTKILERGVQTGEHEKIQGGFGRFQGTWIPLENAKKLAITYGCSEDMMPVLWLDTSDPNLKLLRKAKPLNKDGTPVKRKYVKKKKPDPSAITPSKRAKTDDSISSGMTGVGAQGGLSSSLSSFDPFSSFGNKSQQQSMQNTYPQYQYGSGPNHLMGLPQQQQQPHPSQMSHQNGGLPYHNNQRAQVPNAAPPPFPNQHQLQQHQQSYGNSIPQQRNGNGMPQHYQASLGNYNMRPQNQNTQQPSQASYYLQQYPQQMPQNKLSVSQSTAETTWSEKATYARDSDTSLLSNDERYPPKNGDFDSRLNRQSGQLNMGPTGSNGLLPMPQQPNGAPPLTSSENNYSAQLLQFFSDDTRQIPYFIYNPPFDFDINDPIDDEGHTPLHWAASIGDANMVSLLLSKNANPIVVNNFGLNPLSKLVSFNNCYELKNFPRVLDDLEYCLINTDINGRTPLHYLCQFAKVKSKFESLSYYMDVIFAKLTTLSNQNMSNQVNLLKNVLNHQDVKGDTCLHLAARSESLNFVQYLLDYGARDDLENIHGETARQLVTNLRLAQEFDQLHPMNRHDHIPANPMQAMSQPPHISNDHDPSHMSIGADDTSMNNSRVTGLPADTIANNLNATMMNAQSVTTQERHESNPPPPFVPTPPLNVSFHHRSNSVIDGPDLSQLAYPPHPSALPGLAPDATTSAILATPLQPNHHGAETPDTQRTTIQHDEDLEERPIRIHNNVGAGVGTGIGKALRDQLKLLDEKDEDKENIFVDDTSMKASTPLAVLKSAGTTTENNGILSHDHFASNGSHSAVTPSFKKDSSNDVGKTIVESKQFNPPTLDKFGHIVPVRHHDIAKGLDGKGTTTDFPNKLLMRDLSSMIGGMLNSLSDSYEDELSSLTKEEKQLFQDLQEKREQNEELLTIVRDLLKKNGIDEAETAEDGVAHVKSEAETISQELLSKLNSLMKILERNQAFNLATLVQERELTLESDNHNEEDADADAAWEHAFALTKLQIKRARLMKEIAASIERSGADLKMYKYRKLISLSCGIRVEDIDGLIDGIADLLTENFAA